MEIDIKRMFENFRKVENVWEKEKKFPDEYVKERLDAYNSLRDIFIKIDSLTKESFEKFLRSNKSWDGLDRNKKWYLSDIEKLKKALKYLLKGKDDIQMRFDAIVNSYNKDHIRGIGHGLGSAILHVYDPKEYGVWNLRSTKALHLLGILPKKTKSVGSYYDSFNNKLKELKNILKTNLTMVDCFLGKISEKSKEFLEDFITFDTEEESEEYSEKEVKALESLSIEKLKVKAKEKSLSKKDSFHLVKQRFTNEYVAALAKKRAKGICECCKHPAPFQKTNNAPYLETHHLIPLSKNGKDNICNVCAICPNCHKELHFGENRVIKTEKLLKEINEKNKKLGLVY